MKTHMISALFLIGALCPSAFAGQPHECMVNEMTATDVVDAWAIEDLHSGVNYVKFEVPGGNPCAATLKASTQYPEWAFGDEMRIYSEGRDFCLENGSVWQIMRAENVSPNHSMVLHRVDKDEDYNLFGSPYRVERVKGVRTRWNMTPMLCPGDQPTKW